MATCHIDGEFTAKFSTILTRRGKRAPVGRQPLGNFGPAWENGKKPEEKNYQLSISIVYSINHHVSHNLNATIALHARSKAHLSIFLPPELHHELKASIGAHPLQHCVLGSFDLSLLVVMTPRFVHRAPFLLTLLYFVQGPRSSSHVSRFFLTLALYLLQGITFFRHLRTRRSNTGICRRARRGKMCCCLDLLDMGTHAVINFINCDLHICWTVELNTIDLPAALDVIGGERTLADGFERG
uniref:Uncharacterized protein n=1 Tax=Phlebotomus papatasi TaxID=29031 RepID=A0A1B0DFW0_PHLPP